MARVVWERREAIANAWDKIPYTPRPSRDDFRPPSTIESDFKRLMDHDVPHVNFTFEILDNWYDRYNDGYEPYYIRGQQTAIDWKSKIGNSDMSTNFKTSYDSRINKGDIAIREDGTIYMLNWNITLHANNQATQSVECNAMVEFKRHHEREVDGLGFVTGEEYDEVLCPMIPISHAEYAGRPDYSGASSQAGLHPDHLITVSVQWNEKTKNIRLEDTFVIGAFTYKVVNISLAEVQIDHDYGVLILNAKRVAGGTVSGDES